MLGAEMVSDPGHQMLRGLMCEFQIGYVEALMLALMGVYIVADLDLGMKFSLFVKLSIADSIYIDLRVQVSSST